MDWIPTISDRNGPVYLRIADALAADIAKGRLRRGQQLPTHRALADALRIDLTTVTRAYSEARRRGLTEARVGQGTFVSAGATPAPIAPAQFAEIDLSMILPPLTVEADVDGRIMRGLSAIEHESGLAGYLSYRPSGGSDEERGAAAEWMRHRLPGAQADHLVICPGTQPALLALLATLAAPGDVVLTEALTYPGFKAAAALIGVRLAGVPIDQHGVIPDALKAACRRHRPKAVYLIPTIHNPTTATMPQERRERVAEIIASEGLTLLEDDAYGLLDPHMHPVASLIPQQTYLATTLSKCIAPGLRTSFVLAPDRSAAGQLISALRASVQMSVPLILALVQRWLRDGSADAIIKATRNEAAARQKLAALALAGHAYLAHANGHHVWLPLPDGWSRAEFASQVQRRGLAVVTSEAFNVDGDPPHAIRVSLGAARSRSDLAHGLDILAMTLKSSALTAQIV